MKKLGIIVAALLAGFFFFSELSRAYEEIPSLSLKDSIPIAEKALIDAKVVIEKYFLYSITYANDTNGNYWSYTYRPLVPKESNQVYIRVYMNKTAVVRGGMKEA